MPSEPGSRTAMLKEQPWILIVLGVLLIVGGQNADDNGIIFGLLGFLAAAAGVALWVIKVARG